MKKYTLFVCILFLFCFCLNQPKPVQAAVKLNQSSVSLWKGKTCTLKLSNNKKATWYTSNKKIATVTSSGKVTAKAKGTAYIYAKYNKKKYKCKITVKQPVTAITLNKTSINLKTSATITLKATIAPSTANTKTVKWSSSNKKIASISSDGKITATGPGTATITCKATDGSNVYKTAKVTVTQDVTKIELDKTSATITAESTLCLQPAITPSNASNKTLTWSSSNTKVAQVSSDGVVTALQSGTAIITCTSTDGSKKSATCNITVKKKSVDTTYTINPDSDTYNSAYKTASTYNDLTKHYYLLRSYMEALEANGGGTLLLEAGTYTITNVIYVPSNTKVIFDEGVVLKKEISSTITEAASIFQLVEPSFPKNGSEVKYGYDGAHDITFEGLGDATIDMQAMTKSNSIGSMGIVMGHCQNITIRNLNFVNMSPNGHFIELNSSKNVLVENCTFNGNVTNGSKEAINIDSTDAVTQGFNHSWSSHDLTCVDTVTITNCDFYNLKSAIGTHKYSVAYITSSNEDLEDSSDQVTDTTIQQYHKNVVIENCYFEKVGNVKDSDSAIRMENWANALVENNTFYNCYYYALRCYGVDNPTIRNNTFQYKDTSQRAILFRSKVNTGTGSEYPRTYNLNLFEENFIYNKTNASLNVRIYTYDDTKTEDKETYYNVKLKNQFIN